MQQNFSVLIVDDSPDDRELCSRALKRVEGITFNITECEDGEEALRHLEKGKCECVLLDYSLPGRNGFEILKSIRAKYPFLPVIILTGQGDEMIAVKIMKEGAQDYLTKSSINSDSIAHIIKMAIESCILHQRIELQRDTLETFTRVLTHDLKQPLRMIRSFMQLIEQSNEMSEKNQEFFSHVITATTNMDLLIDMVHYYTKLDALNEEGNQSTVDLNTILSSAKSNLAQVITEKNVSIHSDVLPTVYANDIQLVQLFQNLILNATQHNNSKHLVITIGCEMEGDVATLCVSDNGPGIEKKYLNRIFEPFARFAVDGKGAGLGLAICRKIVSYQGGRIWCVSEVGKGCNFKFTLPCAKAYTRVDAPKGIQIQPMLPLDDNNVTLANVLLVEDDEMDVKLTKIMLFERDKVRFNLKRARNGQEALDILKNSPEGYIDLVLLDINMPLMDGFEFLQVLRNDDKLKATPVIMCSTSTYERDITMARSLGVIDYINKPVTLDKMRPGISGYQKLDLITRGESIELCRN